MRRFGLYAVVFALTLLLRKVPVVGEVFRIPLLGFYFTAILFTLLLTKVVVWVWEADKQLKLVRQLGAVDTPYNQGKLGALILSQGRHRRAVPYLERAVEGEPESPEWHYRLGLARLGSGDLEGARRALERAAELNEEHAYGGALLRLAEVDTRLGNPKLAFEWLERFEHNHGPSPESALRRGLALKAGGHSAEAGKAFEEVRQLARQFAEHGRKDQRRWVLRSYLGR